MVHVDPGIFPPLPLAGKTELNYLGETVNKGIEEFKKTGKLDDDEFLYLFHTKTKESRKDHSLINDQTVAMFHEALDELIDQRKKDIVDPLLTRPERELTPEELRIRKFKEVKLADLESLKSCDETGAPSGDGEELFKISTVPSILSIRTNN